MKQIKIIKFKSVEDFRNRIARLWQDQKENETYEFHFANEDVKKEFDKLIECFTEG